VLPPTSGSSGSDSTDAYSVNDLQILEDHVSLVRKRPEMYLRSDRFSPEVAVGQMVEAALFSGATEASVARLPTGWWVISSARDWLPRGDSLAVFRRIVRFQEAGPNGFRPEILLSAYAADVVTASGSEVVNVKGAADHDLAAHISSTEHLGRLIAFRMDRQR
jgi:hypothetical protein